MNMRAQLSSAQAVIESLGSLEADLERAGDAIIGALQGGGTIFACGNGGSSAEAQHLVAELVGRYRTSRRPLRAVFLGGDVAQMSSIANDFAWDEVFSRPLRAQARPGDLLVSMSTSGRSPNVLAALRLAKEMGLESIAFLGNQGGAGADLATHPLVIPSNDTARIQEAHLFLVHCLCDRIDFVFQTKE